jgi:hypothetical protein
MVGAFALLVVLVGRPSSGGEFAGPALVGSGLFLVVAGVLAMVWRGRGIDIPHGMSGPPDRLKFLGIVGMLCNLVAGALALGVFGILGDLVTMGRHMIG